VLLSFEIFYFIKMHTNKQYSHCLFKRPHLFSQFTSLVFSHLDYIYNNNMSRVQPANKKQKRGGNNLPFGIIEYMSNDSALMYSTGHFIFFILPILALLFNIFKYDKFSFLFLTLLKSCK